MKTNSLRHRQSGFVIVTLLVIIMTISIVIGVVASTAVSNYQQAARENSRVNAQFAADAGLDLAIYEINQDKDWSGTKDGGGAPIEVELLSDTSNDLKTTYSVEVNDIDDQTKTVRSTGKTYIPASASSPVATREFEIQIKNLVASNTSIVAGVGGLVMNNSAKIADGSVYVKGEIYMDNTSQIGTSTNPLSVFVENKVCPIPPDSTFPRECNVDINENQNPIHINSPNSYLYGTVYANDQDDDTNMINVDNPSSSAIIQDRNVPTQELPQHDRNALIDGLPYSNPRDSSVGTPASTASCTTNNGSVIWGGVGGEGQKIKGNVVVSRKCKVEIRGPVWITGSLSMDNQGSIKVADSLGTTRPDIMIDGQNGLKMNQSSSFVQNSQGTSVQIITYWSGASCSPECATVTGVQLANSQDVPTIDIVNAGGAAEAIFYAKWSKVIIRNSVNVGALVGQIVELEQSATIAFSSDLPGFTPRSIWIKKGYLRVYQ